MTQQDIKQTISNAYADKLAAATSCCGGETAEGVYPLNIVGSMPEGVVSFGCGNPVALAALKPGDTVLDLGSGAGMDCFLAAKEVGPEGSVIGVDFTPVMIERANENAVKVGAVNVSFRLGDIEALPVDDSIIDVVMSNCVVNLAPDKDAVFAEAFRVLRQGGLLMVSDLVLTRTATEAEKEDMELLTACVSGSLPLGEYLQKVRNAGFEDVKLDASEPVEEGRFWYSAAISGRKPAR